MGDSTEPTPQWNCLVKSTKSDAIHAGYVDVDGVLQAAACHPRGVGPWELVQPEPGVSYAACGRCINMGAFQDISGVLKHDISSLELDPYRYDPPVDGLAKPKR